MCLTLLQPRVKQSGAPVFKQPIVPHGLLIHFYHCMEIQHIQHSSVISNWMCEEDSLSNLVNGLCIQRQQVYIVHVFDH